MKLQAKKRIPGKKQYVDGERFLVNCTWFGKHIGDHSDFIYAGSELQSGRG